MTTSGKYHYWMNGTQTDITESFRIFSNGTPFGSAQDKSDTVIESFRHAETFGSRISVIAHYTEHRLTHFNVEWENNNPNAVQFANAHYQFTENKIIVNRNIDEQIFLETLPAPEVFTVLPLLRVFTGKAIRQTFALGNGGRIPVLIPNIKNPNDNVQLLTLELDLRSATKLESETITIADKEHQADLFNFHGGNYDQSAKFWIDENDLLLKYEWQQGDVFWEVKLVEVDT